MSAPDFRLTNPAVAQPEIRRGRVPSLALYELTSGELDLLEQGMPSGLFLNLAIFFWSIAAGFFTSLVTGSIASTNTFIVFVTVVVVGCAAGVVLTFLWWRTRGSTKGIIETIKKRIPEEHD